MMAYEYVYDMLARAASKERLAEADAERLAKVARRREAGFVAPATRIAAVVRRVVGAREADEARTVCTVCSSPAAPR